MFGQLMPCGGGQPLPLFKVRAIVGRTAECDVRLPFGTVSSQHCRLELRDGAWFVTDLDSRNGIRIDGVRCREGRLAPGSVLWVAQHRFYVDYVAERAKRDAISPSQCRPEGGVSKGTVVPSVADCRPGGTSLPHLGPRAGASLGELVPCGGGDPIPLLKATLIIGRSPDCDITLAFPVVSAKHCQLEFKEGFWHVRDLGSRNGIRVDGVFQLSKYLRPGEILGIGKLRFEIAYTAREDEPPPDENPFGLSLLEKAGLARSPAIERTPDDPPRQRWTIEDNDANRIL